jgi:hypothetical protein
MFDLDEMKQQWAQYDRKLDEAVRLNRELLRLTVLGKARTELQVMVAVRAVEAMVGFLIVGALGHYVYKHFGTLRLALCGVAVDLYAIGMLAATIGAIAAATSIDYAGPVATIQRQLERLHILRIRTIQFGVFAGTVVWAPLAVIIGFDPPNPAWFWANIAFGLLFSVTGFWIARRFQGSAISRALAGTNIAEARRFLGSLSD